jgi:hypothetical protein
MTDRELHIHMARVHLFHACVSRRHPDWHAMLLRWAAERRRRAMNVGALVQRDLFGGFHADQT